MNIYTVFILQADVICRVFHLSSLEEEGLCVSQPPQGHQQKGVCLWQLELNPQTQDHVKPDDNLKDDSTDWRRERDYRPGRTKGIKLGSGRLHIWTWMLWEDVAVISECVDFEAFDATKLPVDFWKSGVQCSTKRRWQLPLSVCQELCEDLRLAAGICWLVWFISRAFLLKVDLVCF